LLKQLDQESSELSVLAATLKVGIHEECLLFGAYIELYLNGFLFDPWPPNPPFCCAGFALWIPDPRGSWVPVSRQFLIKLKIIFLNIFDTVNNLVELMLFNLSNETIFIGFELSDRLSKIIGYTPNILFRDIVILAGIPIAKYAVINETLKHTNDEGAPATFSTLPFVFI